MKKLLALFLTAAACQAAHVQFDLNDFVSGAVSRRVIDVAPTDAPYTNPNAPAIITGDPIRRYTDTSGQCIISNMAGLPTVYQVKVFGSRTNTVFNILVPTNNVLTNAVYLVTTANAVASDTVGYSQSQANARFVLRVSGYGTNTVLDGVTLTNLGIPVGAASGYFWKCTNANGMGEWAIAPGAGGGEVNYVESWFTNATAHGLHAGKTGASNRLVTVTAGENIIITSQGTNLLIASTAGASGESNIISHVSTTNANNRYALWHSKVGRTNFLKTLSAGTWVLLTNYNTNIVITVSGLQPQDSDLSAIAAMSGAGTFPVQLGAGSWASVTTNFFTTVLSNTIFVSKNGDDSTAAKGRIGQPYGSVTGAVNAATSGDTVLIFPGAYTNEIASNTVQMSISGKDGVSVVGMGQPEIWMVNTNKGVAALMITNSRNILVEGITFGWATNRDGLVAGDCTGVLLAGDGLRNISIIGNRFINTPGNVVTHEDATRGNSLNVKVLRNEFLNSGHWDANNIFNGSCVAGIGSGWNISDNYMSNCMRGIEIEHTTLDADHQSHNTIISRNILVGTREKGIFAQVQKDGLYVSRLMVLDNIINGWYTNTPTVGSATGWNFGISIANGTDVLLARNIIRDVNSHGIIYAGASNINKRIQVINNQVRGTKNNGIFLYSVTDSGDPLENVMVSGNVVSSVRAHGIRAVGHNLQIQNNQVSDVGTLYADCYAIYVYGADGGTAWGSSNVVIQGNAVWDSDPASVTTDAGIYLKNSTNCLVTGNFTGPGITPFIDSGSYLVQRANTHDFLGLTYDGTPDSADFISVLTADGVTAYRTAITDLPSSSITNAYVATNSVGGGFSTASLTEGDMWYWNDTMKRWTNAAAPAGSGNLATNAQQFGENTTLSIKSGAMLTNAFLTNIGVMGNAYFTNGLEMIGDGATPASFDMYATNGNFISISVTNDSIGSSYNLVLPNVGPSVNQILKALDTSNLVWAADDAGTGSGETNTASNIGGTTNGPFASKLAKDLQFNSFADGQFSSNNNVISINPAVTNNAVLSANAYTDANAQPLDADLTFVAAATSNYYVRSQGGLATNLQLTSSATVASNLQYVSGLHPIAVNLPEVNFLTLDWNLTETWLGMTNDIHFSNYVINAPGGPTNTYWSITLTNYSADAWDVSFSSDWKQLCHASVSNVAAGSSVQVSIKGNGATNWIGYAYIVEQ